MKIPAFSILTGPRGMTFFDEQRQGLDEMLPQTGQTITIAGKCVPCVGAGNGLAAAFMPGIQLNEEGDSVLVSASHVPAAPAVQSFATYEGKDRRILRVSSNPVCHLLTLSNQIR